MFCIVSILIFSVFFILSIFSLCVVELVYSKTLCGGAGV